jgi:hypothetical protein
MLRSILFGPASLNVGAKMPNSPKTAGKLWGVSNVTSGAIAGVSVLMSITFVTEYVVTAINLLPHASRLSIFIPAMNNFGQLARLHISTIRKFSINLKRSSFATQVLRSTRSSLHGSISLSSTGDSHRRPSLAMMVVGSP